MPIICFSNVTYNYCKTHIKLFLVLIFLVYGLNDKIGNITYYDSNDQNEYGFTKPYSDVTAQIIDQEISNIIETQYLRAIKLLKKHKNKLIELANFLLDKEVIFKEDLIRIYGERPFDIKKVAKESKPK